MAWIESHSTLIEHHKIREVASILGIEPVVVVGHVHCFWHKVIELREDGDITPWSDQDIAYYARWKGDAKIFYEALKNRFIDEKNGFKLVHDWLDYAWKYLYSKYHQNNPKLLLQIKKKHKKIGYPKGLPKGYPKFSPPNQPNIPNQPNLTEPKKNTPYWAVFTPKTQELLKTVCKDFNIYQLLGRLKKESKIQVELPEEVVVKVCQSFLTNKTGIRANWPWFKRAVVAATEAWNAEQNIKEGRAWKDSPPAPSIKTILAGMK